MKHLKPYKIFESNVSDESNAEIMEVLSHVSDHGYSIKIYDYYYHHEDESDSTSKSDQLFTNKASIKEGTKKSKLVRIVNRDNSDFFNIEGFDKIGFNSSGFHFNNDFGKYREFFLELMDSVFQFSDRNPKLCIRDTDNILILLEYDVVSTEDLGSKDKIRQLYPTLHSLLREEKSKYKYDIKYYPQETHLKITPRGDINQIYNIIASLCFQMKDTQGYHWMTQPEYIQIPEFVNFRENISKEGYEITFKSERSQGQFHDDIVFLISKSR